MRIGSKTFHVRGPFGVEVVLGANVPGRLSISFNRSETSEARSAAASTSGAPLEPSEPSIHSFNTTMVEDSTDSQPPMLASEASSSSAMPQTVMATTPERKPISRAPSLVETEILDENITQEDRDMALQKIGIKVHDFAYPAPFPAISPKYITVPVSPVSNQPHEPPHPMDAVNPSGRLVPEPSPEIFDAYEGLGEFELRLQQKKRVYPIAGKTLHRLMKIGFVSQTEAESRCAPMDLDELERYRGMCAARSSTGRSEDGEYPWRAAILPEHKGTGVLPTKEERDNCVVLAIGVYQADRLRKKAEVLAARQAAYDAWEEGELRKLNEEKRKRTEAAVAAAIEMASASQDASPDDLEMAVDAQPWSKVQGTKRASPCDEDERVVDSSCHPSPPKRTRLSATPTSSSRDVTQIATPVCSRPASPIPESQPRAITPPQKQYPAPLSSYDPKKYPDAARAIEEQARIAALNGRPYHVKNNAQSQPQSQQRATTPVDDSQSQSQAPPPRRLTRRTLSRTATYAIL
ncbi:hypothetical protein HGRIS_010947 [Hohenbuehelia grisea]|uniref:Uncharacterized protein n=1 Tax=Hohenbuehelia grisea TaxID=104357 RepID=A0ABR3IYB5_9AGAR